MKKREHSIASKIGYGLVDVAGGGSFALISLLFLNYLITMEGISPALAGLVVMAGKFSDAIIDPWLGLVSDRTHSRFGRRRVFILAGIAPTVLSFALLWYSFGIDGMVAKAIYYSIMYMMFTISYSIVQVPYNALLPDMVDSYEERAGFSGVRMFISAVSATISVTVPNLLLGPEASRTHVNYLIMGIIFALFYGIPILIGFLSTKEKPVDYQPESLSLRQMFRAIGGTFKNRAYRQFLGIFCCGMMATDIISSMAAFWLTDVLNKSDMLMIFSGITMIVGVLTLPLNTWMAKKYGKQVPAYMCMPFRVLALVIGLFMGAGSGMFLLIFVCVVIGIGTGAASFVPWTLLPDVPDSDEMISGGRNAGLFAGFSTLARTLSGGVAIFITGIILQLFGYVESSAGEKIQQTETALFGVQFMFIIVPAILSLVVIWLGLRYTLTKKNYASIIKAVAHKRESGTPTEDPQLIAACEEVSGLAFADMWVGKKD